MGHALHNHSTFLIYILVLKSERRTKAKRSKNEARSQSAKALGFSYPRRKKII
ncbi:hypothetical protein HanRHA438_Chr11g0482661 [Helianthus annuus]|nr:hypothetical protein HanRHA438_Chr11g0482661 [Helianthus annuus]KAJ0892048.1 hypothetical protein HanPSC8_Chr09g0361271 [Helianthus annuus]